MNYQKIYNQIVEKAKSENRNKLKRTDENFVYYENHHVVPKCLGGSNSKENLVLLTAKEHFVCHKLLVEIYPTNRSLIFTMWNLTSCKNKNRRTNRIGSREYSRIRIEVAKVQSSRVVSEETREKSRKAQTGKVMSKETCDKISNSKKGTPAWNKDKKGIYSEETLEKISLGSKGRVAWNKDKVLSQEHIDNLIKSHTGVKRSKESIEKQRITITGVKRKIITCLYCGFAGGENGVKRYHNENCKLKPSEPKQEKWI